MERLRMRVRCRAWLRSAGIAHRLQASKSQVCPAARRCLRVHSQLPVKRPVFVAARKDDAPTQGGARAGGALLGPEYSSTTFHGRDHDKVQEMSSSHCAACRRAQSFSYNLVQTIPATGVMHYLILRIPFQIACSKALAAVEPAHQLDNT